jgi:hypothetical protein
LDCRKCSCLLHLLLPPPPPPPPPSPISKKSRDQRV